MIETAVLDLFLQRDMAVLLLIFFHIAMIFAAWERWHVRSEQLSVGLEWFVVFVHQWHMPLLFLLAGASTYYALFFRTPRQYVSERFKRLFLPLLFGILVIVPPQVYIERISSWITTRGVSEWGWIVAMLGYSAQYLNQKRPWLRYASEIAYPFYILHQTVIVIVGYYVLQWSGNVLINYTLISTAALVLTLALCELIKQHSFSRVLFGMKPLRRKHVPVDVTVVTKSPVN